MNESQILELLLQKNDNGMNELLIHYGPLMRYIIKPILPNIQDQEDCLSEVAMQVWNNIEKFDCQRGSWKAWLTTIARNYALNYKRNHAAHNNTKEISEDIPSATLSPEEQFIKTEQLNALNIALGNLSPQAKTLFYRKYYYMQSTAQIASEMGLTVRAVEGKLYRIKKQLRKILGGEEH